MPDSPNTSHTSNIYTLTASLETPVSLHVEIAACPGNIQQLHYCNVIIKINKGKLLALIATIKKGIRFLILFVKAKSSITL